MFVLSILQETPVNNAPVGFRCNFCIEMHPTLRAICNHLRKHVQYGEVKAGHVKVNRVLSIFRFLVSCYCVWGFVTLTQKYFRINCTHVYVTHIFIK